MAGAALKQFRALSVDPHVAGVNRLDALLIALRPPQERGEGRWDDPIVGVEKKQPRVARERCRHCVRR